MLQYAPTPRHRPRAQLDNSPLLQIIAISRRPDVQGRFPPEEPIRLHIAKCIFRADQERTHNLNFGLYSVKYAPYPRSSDNVTDRSPAASIWSNKRLNI